MTMANHSSRTSLFFSGPYWIEPAGGELPIHQRSQRVDLKFVIPLLPLSIAAKSIAAISTESIPFIGVAVQIADIGYELYVACETVSGLENKLRIYQRYYNEYRAHSGRDGTTPVNPESANVSDIN
jgi:hypothetical protein